MSISDWRKTFSKAGMVQKLIVLNLLVFLGLNAIIATLRLSGHDAFLEEHGNDLYLGAIASPSALLLRPWSILTYMFAHIEFWHIVGNMLFLWVFGGLFTSFLGERKLLSLYLVGGLSGLGLFIVVFNVFPALNDSAKVVGASAAIMAIVVAISTYMPGYRLNLLLFGPIQLQYIALFYVIYDFASIRYLENTGGHIGHLGGALYGFIWGMQIRKGKDISVWMDWVIGRLASIFRLGGSRMKVVHKRPVSDEDYNASKTARQNRIDNILDKISKGGYESLSKDEKDFLVKYSKE
jgi:membrane associated rhomboid family serine protease